MWAFAQAHPVWFFVYLSTVCLTLSVVATSFLATAKTIVVDLQKTGLSTKDNPEGEVTEDSEPPKQQAARGKVPSLH